MNKKISLLMPTRGRPEWAVRFLKSVAETTSDIDGVEVILYVDEDDVTSHSINYPGIAIDTIIGTRQTMGIYNSECLARSSGDIIVLVNDDMIIRTNGWDDRLRKLDASFEDKIYLSYGNDLFKKGDLCTFPILSRKTCEILQEPYHHAYRGAFIDYHLMDIFKRLEHLGYARITYLDDVVFEHLHYRAGKAQIDATYKARGRFDDDMLFVGLSNIRVISSELLLSAIKKQTNHSKLPLYSPIQKPKNMLVAVKIFTRTFLMDKNLPFRWRFFMWWWFGARYVASYIL